MIDFILQEKILTIGAITGVYTSSLINSFVENITNPIFENLIPTYKLDIDGDGIPDITVVDQSKNKIKWQTFLKDLIIWLVVISLMFIIFNLINSEKKIILKK
jgi:large-conductance mechanosensitive channel